MDMNNLWYYHHLFFSGLVHTTCVLLGYSKIEKPNAVSLLFAYKAILAMKNFEIFTFNSCT